MLRQKASQWIERHQAVIASQHQMFGQGIVKDSTLFILFALRCALNQPLKLSSLRHAYLKFNRDLETVDENFRLGLKLTINKNLQV